jgi:hypothetical protein
MNRGRTVLSLQMILDVIGYLLAGGRQIKQLAFDDGIACPLGNFPIDSRMLAQTVRPTLRPDLGTIELGVVTIHGRAFTRAPNA